MGLFGRIKGFFNAQIDNYHERKSDKLRERTQKETDWTRKRLEKEKMNKRFTDLTKKIVDTYHIGKKKAIEHARIILETPDDELDEIDLDILEEY